MSAPARPGPPSPRDLAELVRLPAVLTVPGDTLAGAAAAGWSGGRRAWLLPVASTFLYWAGMALNDYADRELDAKERPERPIPSGRVSPGTALGLAAGLTGAGVAAAGLGAGRAGLRVAVPLAATVWAYDLVAKNTPLGPAAMAATRGLDVLLGAAHRPRAAALPALAVAVHTAGVTTLSRGEVHGGSPATGRAALAGTIASALLAAIPARRPDRTRAAVLPSLAAGALAGYYAATVGGAQAAAAATPDAATVRAATGTGVRGLIPLQAALLARSGAVGPACALVAAAPVARAASKAVSPT
ncbi:SCO3242 family prenyltransferase [Allonocardiopsis opalescens]|uniref:4-hydroxybenzoate polyprenyltransferase n=1 Tax=Allonocardiopsis opalescens TaxID=1144618 RepID=A0A2T0QCT3_9ACTN|nr:UbiA family prenyltransferase [Allonocardiopsis opalescens]PRY01729.1 4-hydroxybenzoate polyprenyltransferase [Allonocardiopsis opalescens]